MDTGQREISHVRRQPGSDWLTGTRYNHDADGNGLAMEGEAGLGAYYGQTEIVIFQLGDPSGVTSVAGNQPQRLCANSSWTVDGKLIWVQQDHPDSPGWTRIKRATFSSLPRVERIEAVPVPEVLIAPVDPHQWGISDGTGFIVFLALFQHESGWMRPIWKMPAAGEAAFQLTELAGCPLCPGQGGCCAFPKPEDVLGINDPRIDHAGSGVIWMQQHPDVFFQVGPVKAYSWRQHKNVFGGQQQDISPAEVPITRQLAYAEWRADDARLVYWTIEAESPVKHRLYTMAPDGTDRTRIPLPVKLCPDHPSWLDHDLIVFTAWRCGGPDCSCDPARF